MIATDIEKPRNDSFWLTVISILSVVVSAADGVRRGSALVGSLLGRK